MSAPVQHGLSEHSHGAGVPLQIRSDRPRSTSVADFPAITQQQDLWRYLNVDQLKGLDSGVLAEYSNQVSFSGPEGVSFEWILSSAAPVGSIGLPEDRVSAAGYTNASKTLLVKIADELVSAEQITISVKGDSATASALHIFVEAGKFSSTTLVLEHSGLGVLAENVEISVADESKLNFNKTQDQATESTRFAECSSITCGFFSTHFAGKYFSTVVETQCAMG